MPEDAGLTIVPLMTEPRQVVLAADHPLAGKETLTFDDLRDLPTLEHRPDVAQVWTDFWRVSPRPDGRTPLGGPVANSMEAMLAEVATGRCVSFVAAHLPHTYPRPDIVAREVEGLTPRTLGLGWLASNTNPALKDLVALAERR